MHLLDELEQIAYLLYVQFKMIFPYWFTGILAGSFISVFLADRISGLVERLHTKKHLFVSVLTASLLGAASPLCMYGTVPIIASLGKRAIAQHLLVAFMVSSILINPNLFLFSFALGAPIALLRLLMCMLAGIAAGLLIHWLYPRKKFFQFDRFEGDCKSAKPRTLKGYLQDLNKAVMITAPFFFIGILLVAIIERYVPKMFFINLFGSNRELGVLVAVTMGVPVYMCGGGTIPLLRSWLNTGMSPGAAIAFSLSGASTKLTNLSALKIILGFRNFAAYLSFNIVFAIASGWLIDIIYQSTD